MMFRKAYSHNPDNYEQLTDEVVGVYFMGYTVFVEELEDMANTLGYRLVKKEEKENEK